MLTKLPGCALDTMRFPRPIGRWTRVTPSAATDKQQAGLDTRFALLLANLKIGREEIGKCPALCREARLSPDESKLGCRLRIEPVRRSKLVMFRQDGI